jgi:excisionase family DNA binding protein
MHATKLLQNDAHDAAEASPLTPLLTTLEAASLLGIGKRTLQELVAERQIGFLRIGRSVRFHVDDLRNFIQTRKIKAQGWKGEAR